MTSAKAQTPAKSQGGGGSNSMLLELVDRILDKGIVIDAWARVSVLSIELLTVEARVVVASVDTYLRYAEAIGNTALASMPHPQTAQGQQQGQQQGQLGGQQAGGQQPQQLPAPQQQNLMSNLTQQGQAQPQPAQQPQQAQPQPQQTQQPQQMQPQPQPQQQQQVNRQPGT